MQESVLGMWLINVFGPPCYWSILFFVIQVLEVIVLNISCFDIASNGRVSLNPQIPFDQKKIFLYEIDDELMLFSLMFT